MGELSAPPVSLQVDCDRADAQTAHRQGNFKRAEDTLDDARRLLETSKKTYLSAYTSVLSDLGGIYNDTARPQQALAMTQLIGATHELYGRGGTGARLMAMQNEAVRHGVVAVNVGFVTGDIQQLGERLIAETVPGPQSKGGLQAPVILTILVCYAFGAAIGALAAGWGAAALLGPAALLTGAVLLPERWTGLAAQRH